MHSNTVWRTIETQTSTAEVIHISNLPANVTSTASGLFLKERKKVFCESAIWK